MIDLAIRYYFFIFSILVLFSLFLSVYTSADICQSKNQTVLKGWKPLRRVWFLLCQIFNNMVITEKSQFEKNLKEMSTK